MRTPRDHIRQDSHFLGRTLAQGQLQEDVCVQSQQSALFDTLCEKITASSEMKLVSLPDKLSILEAELTSTGKRQMPSVFGNFVSH